MIKCEVIKQFTLQDFYKLKNIVRFNSNLKKEGELYLKDIFECDEKMVKYLTGDNEKGEIVVKVIEVEPEKEDIKLNQFGNPIGTREFIEKPKTTKKKKSSKK